MNEPMNKTAIKNFAIWARNKLITDIQYRAGLMGITKDGVKDPLPQSTATVEFYDIGTPTPYSITGEAIPQRKKLAEVIRRKERESDYPTAYKYILEEVAYTWFNRLIAIRFMEVNDYLPSHIRVLSSESGKIEPDLVTTPFDAGLTFTAAEEETVLRLKTENKLDELFRLLFIKQCNALNAILPALFETTSDYTELLLNLSVVDQEGVVYRLVHDISEDDFNIEKGGQVEIIGWLYQYYNTEPKNAAFAKNGKITKEEIPAVTQLFTPDWIVRYMVENSLGRIFIEGQLAASRGQYSEAERAAKEKELADQMGWRYYLPEAEQTPEVRAQLDKLPAGPSSLDALKLIDPCMGSGHILVYAFDVLIQMYEKEGYSQRDAAQCILQNNLFGLDIDKRAAQLAYFAVMMKARQYDRRIFSRGIQPHVYALRNSDPMPTEGWGYLGEEGKIARRLQDSLADAEEYGSLLKPAVTLEELDKLQARLVKMDEMSSNGSFVTMSITQSVLDALCPLIELARMLVQKYDVVVTNPPYMGSSNMDARLSEFVKKNYPDSKADLFAVFIERCGQMTAENRYQAMITQHAWMFLSSFEKLREKLLQFHDTVSMAHLGPRAFEEIGGEVVQTTSFVLRNSHIADYKGTYCRLIEPTTQQGKEDMFLSGQNRYTAQQENFEKIPGARIGYWLSNTLLEQFEKKPISAYADTRRGLQTGDSGRFIRKWYEVSETKEDLQPSEFSKSLPVKWFLFNSGGVFRRWYGNIIDVVDWEKDGRNIKSTGKAIIPSENRYFDELISWNKISSGQMSVRYQPVGIIPGDASPFLHSTTQDHDIILYAMAIFNSKIAAEIVKVLSPTLNFEVGNIAEIPVAIDESSKTQILYRVNDCIDLGKKDWDSYETSWDFKRHPLL